MSDNSKKELEEGTAFTPRFDKDGLIPCITTSAGSGEVLMFAWMNREALEKSLETGEAWYWSRSRNALWHKGTTSGFTQKIISMKTDCDQDCIWIGVEVSGPEAACHTGRQSCFYRSVELGKKATKLAFTRADKIFDPKKVYGD